MKLYSFVKHAGQIISAEVEVALVPGVPQIHFLGLPDNVIKESELRIKSAFCAQGFEWPYAEKVIVNIRPNHIKKSSQGVELAVAVAVLAKTGQLFLPENYLGTLYGEITLSGEIIAPDDIGEVTSDQIRGELVTGVGVKSLPFSTSVCKTLADFKVRNVISPQQVQVVRPELSDIRVCEKQSELLQVMAVGRHPSLLAGAPGTGKSTLAEQLVKLLPEPSEAEFWSTVKFSKSCGVNLSWRPLVTPHHTSTVLAMVGGGATATFGEITRAHNGVLLLDEFLEFHPKVQEAMREPMETGLITVSRALNVMQYPADFSLVATTNLCHCGRYEPKRIHNCTCAIKKRKSYLSRFSGPILDRFQILQFASDWRMHRDTPLEEVQKKIDQALAFQKTYKRSQIPNQRLRMPELLRLSEPAIGNQSSFLETSQRRTLAQMRVARTLADIEGEPLILRKHLQKASKYTLESFRVLQNEI